MILEDGSQLAQLIVSPRLWEGYSSAFQTAEVLVVEGRVEAAGALVTVVVEQVWGMGLEARPDPRAVVIPKATLIK